MRRIRNKISFILSRIVKPVMIGGYKIPNGIILKTTRVSNTTFINCKEKLIIGENVFIGHYNFIEASNGITIEEGCQITNYVSITSHSSHNSIRLYGKKYQEFSEHIGYVKGDIHIGKYTFIGPHSVIMPGSKIGKGSIVGAFTYVDGIFPDYSIIQGNPAKIIGNTKDVDDRFLEQHPELKDYYYNS